MTVRILACDDVSSVGLDVLRQAGFEVVVRPAISHADLIEVASGFDALLVRSRTSIDEAVLEAAGDRLKVIGRAGFGLDRVAVSAAEERGVTILQSPEGIAVTAAEFTLGLLFCIARNIPRADAALRAGRWDKRRNRGVQLFGKTLGILGMGNVGRAVAERAVVLGMNVQVHDPLVPDVVIAEVGALPVSWDTLLTSSDFISVHVSASPRTRDLVDERAFGRMKEGVRLVNCSRGGVVSEAALVQAIKTGRVAGAAVDVFDEEPPWGSELLNLPQVVVTPHLVSSTFEAQIEVARELAEQVRDFFLRADEPETVQAEGASGLHTEAIS